ncbi:cystathionine gamma-lyase cys3 [Coemansia sp. 'formosensis']|uniref:Cystathionine gamma-lyase cys3 n=1 Tax=Coemansia furcata TaxID=417177 RepID=A0ACC1LMG0_9FUNG|nr:cystathionine gamma-lyase cys3 [Coemansia furcata]KAJ2820414.1 cystathionine gamma-lyase cys3 [Coemansia sp. 'formosensis']
MSPANASHNHFGAHAAPITSATYGFGTLAIHAGSEPDAATGAVIPPLSLSTTFKQRAVGDFVYEYSRSDNPNRSNLEAAIAALEHGTHGFAFSSGSATTATVLNTLPQGSHVISVNDVYGGTHRYLNKVAQSLGITTTFVDLAQIDNLRDAIRENSRLVWIETPTNPTLRLVDIAAVAEIAHEAGMFVVVDNTFLSPYFQTPLELGADIVVHSATKYINGHSDVVMGVAVTSNDALASKIRFLQNAIGAVPSPFDCYQAQRGIKTLHLRMRQHALNAQRVAEYLEASPFVESVIYPGLKSHPQHELACRQMRGFGGMVSFRIRGDTHTADRFLQRTRLFTLAESLGGVESLAELPARMTHAGLAPEERNELGITGNLIRLSVGVEDVEDLVADIAQALDSAVRDNSDEIAI